MKPYQALIWNEWRQIRGNVLALAGVTALLWLMLLIGSYNKAWAYYIEMISTAFALGLPLLYSIVLADSFAREFSQKTDSFLLELPVSPAKIFFCKYFANLLPFLGLAAFETLLMLHLTRVAPGKHFTDGLMGRNWIIVLVVIAATWIFAHAMVFLTSLLSKKTGNGIVAIIIMSLPIVLLLPGTMAITMFFVISDHYWIIASLLLTLIILYCFCIGFVVYLWVRRIACGRKILKPVIAALALNLTVSWILYGAAYLYFSHSFNLAVREARAAGLEMDVNKLILPQVPAEQNAAPEILKFYKLYFAKSQAYRKAPGPLPSPLWTETNFHYSGKTREIIPQESILEVTDFIMNEPRMNQCYTILSEALKKTYCRFSMNSTIPENDNRCFNLYIAGRILSYRAYAFRVLGDDDDFFICLAGIDKLSDALTEQPFSMLKEYGLMLKTIKYQTAIACGPDTVKAVKLYNEMIHDIDSINLTMPDETFRIYGYLEEDPDFYSRLGDSDESIYSQTDMMTAFIRKCKPLYLPRKLQSAAAWIRWKIQANKLLKQALTNTSRKAIDSEFVLYKAGKKIPGIFNTIAFEHSISSYFRFRAYFESYKLCLALKVYHIKYGMFPDSLQKLVPELLTKVPINPQTGEDYIYQAEADGFYLSGRPNYDGIKYKPWKIETEKAK